MNKETLSMYEKFWKETEMYYLGPVDIFLTVLPDWGQQYGVYIQEILGYIPMFIYDSEIRQEVIKRMLDAKSKLITKDDIIQREDITRLWGDRKHEFLLRRYELNDKYLYGIVYRPFGTAIRIGYSGIKYTEIIKKMMEAGVEILDWEPPLKHNE